MNHIELAPSQKITIVFDGKEYPARKPKMGAAMALEEKLEAAKTSGQSGTRLLLEFLTQCGLPMEMVQELDADQAEAVVNVLTPAKKN